MEIKYITIDTNAYRAFKKADNDAVEIIRHIPNIIINPISDLIVISNLYDLKA